MQCLVEHIAERFHRLSPMAMLHSAIKVCIIGDLGSP